MGIRKIKRNISKFYAEKNGLKPNCKYRKESEENSKSGTKIIYEKLFGKEE